MQNDILRILNSKQQNYEFPILDNYNFDLSQIKLSVFLRSEADWLIVFQAIGADKLGASNWIYMFGNTVDNYYKSVIDDTILRLSSTGEHDLYDEEGEFIPSLYEGGIIIRNIPFKYNFVEQDYMDKNIEIKESESYLTYFLRMLSEDELSRNLMWWSNKEILEELDDNYGWELWYEAVEWQHVMEEEVTENVFFQTLARAIQERDINLINKGEVNTNWRNWVESDFENQ